MDFFQRQANARRQTRRLVFLFILAVIGVAIAVNLVVTIIVANTGAGHVEFVVPDLAWIGAHPGLLGLTSLGTGAFIGAASLFRIASLGSGGATVARSLGGTQVTPDTTDPLRRRLYNVVEEMAIASGVPVPEVYVLEQEANLNAFAAGYTPGDAVVAVTRGSLETFSREELQGVIGHEFSHILNGDMRLNMRLIGVLFGILVIGLIGRGILRSTRYVRGRGSRDSGGAVAAMVAAGAALTAVGYIGLFFGRLIKAGVSRQREYLADASAVQFTRQTEGIAGALKKIGYAQGSVINDSDGEEISHMFFANGIARLGGWFATHPPIDQRILALDPSFRPEEFVRQLARAAAAQNQEQKPTEDQPAASKKLQRLVQSLLVLTPELVSNSVGNPSDRHVQHAGELRRAIPQALSEAAHTTSGAVLLSFALLLDPKADIRHRQLAVLQQVLGTDHEKHLEQLRAQVEKLGAPLRLPLLELAFPALKRRPDEQIAALLRLIDELIETDGNVDTFEYLVSRTLRSHLRDAQQPQRVTTARNVTLADSVRELHLLFSVVAHVGQDNPQQAARAYQLGMHRLLGNGVEWPAYAAPGAWSAMLDAALDRLDGLPEMVKQELVKALTATIAHDRKVTSQEAELLRAICIILHCPLPPFLPDKT